MQTVVLHSTKTLAAYQLLQVERYAQLFTDGTSQWHTAMENVIIGFMSDNGFMFVTLSSSILQKTETAESCTEAILDTFKEGRELLMTWQKKHLLCSLTNNIYLTLSLSHRQTS